MNRRLEIAVCIALFVVIMVAIAVIAAMLPPG